MLYSTQKERTIMRRFIILRIGMKKSLSTLSCILMAFALTACATGSITPTYVSPSKYQNLDCSQLKAEHQRLQAYLDKGVQGSSSRIGTGIGIGLGGGYSSGGGWGIMPSISINMGQSTSTKRTETARLMGEQDAVAQSAKFKNCPFELKENTQKP